MGWKKTPKQEAQRDDYATELAKKLQASDTKTSRIWKACLMEIAERSPDVSTCLDPYNFLLLTD
jgi:hypothetical protein